MSDEEELTVEEEAELRRIADAYQAAAKFASFVMVKMETGELGIATNDEEVAMEYAMLLAKLVQHLSGSKDEPKFHLELGPEDDSASGGAEPDPREAGGDIRPGNRKLH